MKTFINVLYRRILYKIPLKVLLLLLAVFGVLFACFSNAVEIPLAGWEGNTTQNGSIVYVNQSITTYNTKLTLSDEYDFYCLIRATRNNGNSYSFDNSTWYNGPNWNLFCDNRDIYLKGGEFLFYYYKFGQGMLPEQFDSLKCQTEYNLIPISSVDQNYCITNNLCPSIPIGTGNLTQLYINNILHVGAPTILMNIPDEIDWDYAYTQGGNVMNIDIVGYNVDYQAVEDQIVIQKYKPNSDELSGIISGIIPLFVPGLCIILLLYFIFKFIKKVF